MNQSKGKIGVWKVRYKRGDFTPQVVPGCLVLHAEAAEPACNININISVLSLVKGGRIIPTRRLKWTKQYHNERR